MAKFSAVAERMAKVRAQDDAEADKLMQRLDQHEKRRPSVIARGHAFLDSQKAEMDDMESGLTQLSNLPLDESTASPGASSTQVLPRPGDA